MVCFFRPHYAGRSERRGNSDLPGWTEFLLASVRLASSSLLVEQGSRNQDQRIDISGNVELTARPNLLPEWRVQPNLSAFVTIGQASVGPHGHEV